MHPQPGWKILHVREIRKRSKKSKKKLTTIKLSRFGVFSIMVHRDFPLDRVNRLIAKLTRSERMYITFVVDHEFPKLPNTGNTVAIDVCTEKMLVTSDCCYFPNLKPLEKALWKVKHLHKSLSREKFLSNNCFKAKIKLAKAYEHLHDLKRDLYMRLWKWFAEHYDVIIEDIHVKQLIDKSSKSLRRLTEVSFSELR